MNSKNTNLLNNTLHDKNTYSSFIFNTIKEISHKSNEEVLYIITLCFDKNNSIIEDKNLVIEHLFKLYKQNFKIITKHIKIKNKIKNTDDFILLLKKRNSYVLFEKIDYDNINFFLTYWEHLHS